MLSLDEKTQIQALSRTQPLLPLRPGLAARQTHDYAATASPACTPRWRWPAAAPSAIAPPSILGPTFCGSSSAWAAGIERRDLHVVLDNSSTHKTPAVQAWLAEHPHVQFHFTPKGASGLNMVEAWFSILTRKSVRRGSFNTVMRSRRTHRGVHQRVE